MKRYMTSCGVLVALLLLALPGCGAARSAQPKLTPSVTATPTASGTPTTADLLTDFAQGAVGTAGTVNLTYDARSEQANVTVTVTGDVPRTDAQIAATHTHTKALCLWEQRGLWSVGLPLSQVTVTVMGPAMDAYDGVIDKVYGIATVNRATANVITWPTATPESAWNTYNFTWLRPTFAEVDPVPVATPTQ